jgi:hypothetical protein
VTTNETFLALDDRSVGNAAWTTTTAPVRLAEIGAAGALAAVLMVMLWLGLRPDLGSAPSQPFFWLKAVYTGVLALAGLHAARGLMLRHGTGAPALAIAGALVATMLIAASIQADRIEPAFLARLFRPRGILDCVRSILGLAAPMLVFSALGLRGLDLERPAAVGLAAGLFCGGVAATILGLHCPHATFVFVGLWYTAAIGLCGLIGSAALVLARRHGRPHPE